MHHFFVCFSVDFDARHGSKERKKTSCVNKTGINNVKASQKKKQQ
jgi:hypothetical protein